MLASEAGDLGSTPNGSTTFWASLARQGQGQGQGQGLVILVGLSALAQPRPTKDGQPYLETEIKRKPETG